MCMLHLYYTLTAILISQINHHYQAMWLVIYWGVPLGCSDASCFARKEVKYQEPPLFLGLHDIRCFFFLPTCESFRQSTENSEVVRTSSEGEKQRTFSDIKATSLEPVRCSKRASNWMCQSIWCPSGPNSVLFCGFQHRWAFWWLRLCLHLLITVSIYLSNRQRPLAFFDDIHEQHARAPSSCFMVVSCSSGWPPKSALWHQRWFCWVVTVCRHHQACICICC